MNHEHNRQLAESGQAEQMETDSCHVVDLAGGVAMLEGDVLNNEMLEVQVIDKFERAVNRAWFGRLRFVKYQRPRLMQDPAGWFRRLGNTRLWGKKIPPIHP